MTKITWLYFLLGLVFVGAENGAADNMYMWGEGFAFFPQNLRKGGGGLPHPAPTALLLQQSQSEEQSLIHDIQTHCTDLRKYRGSRLGKKEEIELLYISEVKISHQPAFTSTTLSSVPTDRRSFRTGPKKMLEVRSVQDLKIVKRTSKDLFFDPGTIIRFFKMDSF